MVHIYKLGGHNIVLDIESGSVHSVDDVTYDVIGMYEEKQDNIAERVKKLHPDVTGDEIRAILDDIEKLVLKGMLFTPDNTTAALHENSVKDTPLKALCLNVSHACNMSCEYCFVQALASDAETQTPNSSLLTPDFLMPFDTGKRAVDFLIENSGDINTLDIDFFGGEPLLNWQVVKELVAYARMAGKFTGKKFRFTLTTNGLLIDDDVIDFTNKYFYNAVLSLDGRPQTHNLKRRLPGGGESYDEVMPKIKKLVEARRGKGYYIRGTYTRDNMDFVKDILHLADDLGFLQLSLEPAAAKRGDAHGFTDDDLPALLREYDVLAIEMQRRKEFSRFVRPEDIPAGNKQFNFYHYNIDLEHGPCLKKRIAGCGVAAQYLAVTPAGGLYPCHRFIGDEKFLMGDVWQGITNKQLRDDFAAANIFTRKECKACWAKYYCSGGCAANAFFDTGSVNGIYKFGCELFKKRIECAIMLKFN